MANRTKVRFQPRDAQTHKVGAGGVLANRGCMGNNLEEVVVATAATRRFAGVPLADTAASGATPETRREVTVYRGKTVLVQFSAAANFKEDLVISTADGQFGPAGATPAVGTVVARAEQQMSGPGLGWAYIYPA